MPEHHLDGLTERARSSASSGTAARGAPDRKSIWSLVRAASNCWLDDRCARMGAALSYYTAFSLAPLLLIAVAVAGFVFGREAAMGRLFEQTRDMVGDQGAALIETMVAESSKPSSGIAATIAGIAMLLLGAIGLFGELQDSLNTVWGVQPRLGRGWRGIIRDRLLSLSMV